ncbi:MAG: FAD-dependent oxidoreductase [Chloroflexota bacterium]
MNSGSQSKKENRTVIIGGGPAGLTAAYELLRHGIKPIVLEKLDKVGGIARTENYKGYHFDMGGHRFFTKSEEVQQFWDEILGDDFLVRPRLSRIFYKNKYFNYPLKPLNALLGLGPFEGFLIGMSYIRWQLFPYKEEETFEQWVTNRFGKRLFETFFKSYTEKVWGIKCSELKAEWAAQRIKDLSLKTAVLNMFFKPQNVIKTLIEEFHYPRKGPGLLWTTVQEKIEQKGGMVCLESDVVSIQREGNRVTGVEMRQNGRYSHIQADTFISSMPLPLFLKGLNPPAPPEIQDAASKLKHRDFLTVCLMVDQKELFPDNWIYIHDPSVHVGRIQNFKNWSPEMVPDQNMSSLGLEYFCNEGDELWSMPDKDLIALAKKELAQIGLASENNITDGCVYRVEKTYPIYDEGYAQSLETIKNYVNSFENFQTIGRNGLHRYNNQDHAMLTGMYAIRNLLFQEDHNLWLINAEDDYLEEVSADKPVHTEDVVEAVKGSLGHVFPKLDPLALGISLGAVVAIGLAILTLIVVPQGESMVADYLALINQFFPGYSVTIRGSLLGAAYGYLVGFIIGWLFAFLRNAATAVYITSNFRSAQSSALRQFFDYI